MTRLSHLVWIAACLNIFNACSKPETRTLEGTWRMEACTYIGSGKSNGVESNEITNKLCLKIFGASHFALVEMFKTKPDSLLFAALGKYQLTQDKYFEKYDASNVGYETESWREFKYFFERDSLIMLSTSNEVTLKEVWVRIEE